jgi:hypothetical protein
MGAMWPSSWATSLLTPTAHGRDAKVIALPQSDESLTRSRRSAILTFYPVARGRIFTLHFPELAINAARFKLPLPLLHRQLPHSV